MNASNSALDASRFAQVASDTRNNTARAGSSAGGGGGARAARQSRPVYMRIFHGVCLYFIVSA